MLPGEWSKEAATQLFRLSSPSQMALHLWILGQYLVSTVGLVASALEVLLECCLGWRKVLQVSRLLCEELFPGIIHYHALTGSVVLAPQIALAVTLILH